MSTFLFGDDLNKEVKELTKSQKLSNKVNPKRRMEPYKVPASRGVCRRGRFSQSAGRGRAPSNSFLGQGLGHTRPPAESQDLGNQDPVGSPAEVCTENNSRPCIRNSSNSLVDNSALFYGCT